MEFNWIKIYGNLVLPNNEWAQNYLASQTIKVLSSTTHTRRCVRDCLGDDSSMDAKTIPMI